MPDVEISYKGTQIASMSASGVKTLLTGDSFCEDDIIVSYTKPSAPAPTLQSKTVSPSTSQQTVSPDSGYDGLSQVKVNAMPSGTAGTPTATKGTVSNHSVSVTPSVTNTTGYITGGTKTGTAVTVDVTELESGTKSITENGTGISVSGYSAVDVSVSGSGGLEYETGAWTPSEDVSLYYVYFTNAHSTAPMFYAVADVTSSSVQTSSNFAITYTNFENAFGEGGAVTTSTMMYGLVGYRYNSGSTTSSTGSTNLITVPLAQSDGSTAAHPTFWATNERITLNTTSNSRFFHAGRTYKWIALWAHTT